MPENFTDQPILTERFDRALDLASDHHRRQLRDEVRVPYLAHVLAVATITLEMDGDEDEAIAAILHDTLNDGDGPLMLARIREGFGDTVADIVAATNDTDAQPKPGWRERKLAYIDAIPEWSRSAVRVSLADNLHDARSIVAAIDRYGHEFSGDEVWPRLPATRDEVCWFYDAVATGLERRLMTRPETVFLNELRRLALAMSAPSPREGVFSDRLTWVERALLETRGWIEGQRSEAAIERMFMAPVPEKDFEWAYDAAVARATRQADQTVAALEAERDDLVRGQGDFRSRSRRP